MDRLFGSLLSLQAGHCESSVSRVLGSWSFPDSQAPFARILQRRAESDWPPGSADEFGSQTSRGKVASIGVPIGLSWPPPLPTLAVTNGWSPDHVPAKTG